MTSWSSDGRPPAGSGQFRPCARGRRGTPSAPSTKRWAMPQIGSTSWPRAAAQGSPRRRGEWPRGERVPGADPAGQAGEPARPLAMQFTESFDQRSPQSWSSPSRGHVAHDLGEPPAAPTPCRRARRSKPIWLRSVRSRGPAHAAHGITQPRHRSRPAAAYPLIVDAVLKSTMTPSGLQVLPRPRHSVS